MTIRTAVKTSFKKGHTPWNKGKKNVYSLEHLKRLSEIKKKNPVKYWLGKELSEKHKGKLKDAKGKGEHNHLWKGKKASLIAQHEWIRWNYGNAKECQNQDCYYPRKGSKYFIEKPKYYHWANISLKYKRDVRDYIQLCPSCHKKWDMGVIAIKIGNKLIKHK